MTNERIQALAQHLQVKDKDIEEDTMDNSFIHKNGDVQYPPEYLVLTDDEADTEWDRSLDNYIDEVIMSEIPEMYQMYFDDERWKDDARVDGRGHSLNGYDGSEEVETVNGTDYYIYRTN